MDMGPIWMTAILLASATTILSALILYVYVRALRYTKSKLTVGLTLFAMFLIIQGLLALHSYTQLAARFGPEVGLPSMLLSLTQLLAITFLLIATWQ